MMASLANSVLAIAFPVECNLCGREVENHNNGIACEVCWNETRIFSGKEMLCIKCGAFFGPESASTPVRCHQCDEHQYDNAFAIGIYEKALAASILRLKSAPILGKRIDEAIGARIGRIDLGQTDLIIPTPLSRQRRGERGFNQAELIADKVSRSTGIKVDAKSLARKLHTAIHRQGMDKRGRELSVINAFEVARPKLISGKSILLVDDVFTSGATTSSCAKALKKSGAVKVDVFTIARAVMR